MLRDGHVDGLRIEVTEMLVLIAVVSTSWEPEVNWASSRNADAAKAGLDELNMSLSSSLPIIVWIYKESGLCDVSCSIRMIGNWELGRRQNIWPMWRRWVCFKFISPT